MLKRLQKEIFFLMTFLMCSGVLAHENFPACEVAFEKNLGDDSAKNALICNYQGQPFVFFKNVRYEDLQNCSLGINIYSVSQLSKLGDDSVIPSEYTIAINLETLNSLNYKIMRHDLSQRCVDEVKKMGCSYSGVITSPNQLCLSQE